MVNNGSKSFMEYVKAKYDLDPTLDESKEVGLYQGRLRVSNIDDLRERILSDTHSFRYSIHSGPPRCTLICGRYIGEWNEK